MTLSENGAVLHPAVQDCKSIMSYLLFSLPLNWRQVNLVYPLQTADACPLSNEIASTHLSKYLSLNDLEAAGDGWSINLETDTAAANEGFLLSWLNGRKSVLIPKCPTRHLLSIA